MPRNEGLPVLALTYEFNILTLIFTTKLYLMILKHLHSFSETLRKLALTKQLST